MANSVIDAIFQVTSDTRVRMAMVMGSKLESGWNPNAVGDGGTSFGPFQIHLPAHPTMNKAKATNPLIAAQYMLGSYQSAVNKVPSGLWSSDPAMASARAAFYAERPKVFYGESRVRSVWDAVKAAMSGQDVGEGYSGAPGSEGGVVQTGITESIINPILQQFADLFNKTYFALLIGTGGLFIAVGFYILIKENTKTAATIGKTGSAFGAVLGPIASLGRKS